MKCKLLYFLSLGLSEGGDRPSALHADRVPSLFSKSRNISLQPCMAGFEPTTSALTVRYANRWTMAHSRFPSWRHINAQKHSYRHRLQRRIGFSIPSVVIGLVEWSPAIALAFQEQFLGEWGI